MPNWNSNTLTLSDASPELIEYLKAEGLSFSKILPVDRDAVRQEEAWGTKWDLSEGESRETADELIDVGVSQFDTAWSPPIGAIKALSERFPHDEFRLAYYEGGMGFYGVAVFSDGCADVTCESDMDLLSPFLQQEMGYDKEDADDEAGLTDTDDEPS